MSHLSLRVRASLVLAATFGALESPEVVLGAKLGRNGTKFRLVYTLQTVQQPRLTKQLAYEFAQAKLSDRGVTAMAQEIVAEAVRLEESRKSRPAEQPSAPVAAAPTPPPSTPSAPESEPSTAPVAAAPSEPAPAASSNQPEYEEDPAAERERRAAEWKEARRPRHKLDVGAAAGFNSPSGIYGLEVEYRPLEYVGINLGGGPGAWGTRITPSARLYPLGLSGASLFLEGGLSINTGGEATVTVNDEPEQIVDLMMTPVATAAVGVRFNIDRIYFTPRVGWGFRMREDNYRSRDGSEIGPLFDTAIGLFQHGGFLISLTVGATFL